MENDISRDQNPYAPPQPMEKKLEDEPSAMVLNRAFWGATYGTLFLPIVGNLISCYLLMGLRSQYAELNKVGRRKFHISIWLNVVVIFCGLILCVAEFVGTLLT